MGLTMLFNYDDPCDPANKELMENINIAAYQLDDVIRKVVKATEA
jgi:hypothetical protein